MSVDGSHPSSSESVPSRSPRRFNGERRTQAERRLDAQLLDRIRAEHERSHSIGEAAAGLTKGGGQTPTAGSHPTVPVPQPCPEYEVLANRLVGYAVPLFKSLLRTGRIKKELLDRNLPTSLTGDDYERLHTSMAARDALAIAIVIAGEEYFRRTVIPQMKWNAEGGAGLETFFVNGCMLHFAASARSWRKEHPEWTGPAAVTGL